MVTGKIQRARIHAASAAIVFVLVVTGAVIAIVTNFEGQWEESPLLITMLAFGLLGALVLWRRPGNAMGWVFSAMGLSGTVAAAAPESGPATLLGALGWFTFFFLTFTVLPLLYPTGQVVGPRWRWVLAASLVAYASFAFLWLFQETVCVESEMSDGEEICLESVPNPIGIEGIDSGTSDLVLSSFIVAGIAALASMVIRYRRSRGIERQQLKWLLFSLVALMSFVFIIDILLAEWFGIELDETLYSVLVAILWLGLPTTAGLAVFRFGLYDIDRVISRTLAYAIVVATLTGAYVGAVIGVGAIVDAVGPTDSGLPVPLLATALVAIAFQPVRQRAVGAANRLVFGKRRTPYEALAGLADAGIDELLPLIAQTATESTAARGAIVWLHDGEELRPAATFPENMPRPAVPLRLDGANEDFADIADAVVMSHQGELLGAITVVTAHGEELPAADRRLLADLAAHAAVTLHGALEAIPLPTGIVTFMMTDIEGSTRLWEEDPEAMADALRAHDAVTRRIISDGDGVLVKWRGEGDSTFSVFVSATQAVVTAAALQEAIRGRHWETVRPISIRIALHTGEAELRERDYFGQTVNRCARLRSLARGGQTLVSAATRELAREGLLPDLHFVDLGRHELKDVNEAEQVYELAVAATTDEPAELRLEA